MLEKSQGPRLQYTALPSEEPPLNSPCLLNRKNTNKMLFLPEVFSQVSNVQRQIKEVQGPLYISAQVLPNNRAGRVRAPTTQIGPQGAVGVCIKYQIL